MVLVQCQFYYGLGDSKPSKVNNMHLKVRKLQNEEQEVHNEEQ